MSRRIAVLIASSRFPDEPQLTGLEAPERDVDGVHEVLAAARGGVFDEVVVLKNEPSQRVRLAINRALRAAKRDDQLLIYYSGHGKLDPTGKLCLTMTDTVLDVLEASSIRIGEIKDFLDASKCKQVMLFLDCCYSGAVGKDFVARSAVEDQLQVAAESAGICIMSAANAVQIALEDSSQGLGVFTRHVIEGIRSGAADQNGDGLVTFDELYDYVQKRVIADGHQRPQRWAFQAEGALVIARSGNWDELRKRLRAKLLELAHAQELPDDVVGEALALLSAKKAEFTREQTLRLSLLEELAAGKTKLASFSFAWARIVSAPPAVATAGPEVEAPPAEPPRPAKPAANALETWPKQIDFGRRERGADARELLKVWHNLPGDPGFEFRGYGSFFELDRHADGLMVTLVDDAPGTKQGLIKIESVHGAVEVEVRARVVEPARREVASPPATPATPAMPTPRFTPGRWKIELNAFGIPGATYTLDIYPNGMLAGGVTVFGLTGQVQGTWGYDLSRDILGMQLAIQTFGVQSGETLQIQITEGSGANLTGNDPMFRSFRFTRLGDCGVG